LCRRLLVPVETEEPDLLAIIDFHLQRLLILPGDVETDGHAHDPTGSKRAALLA
jgi:hypothetical protein